MRFFAMCQKTKNRDSVKLLFLCVWVCLCSVCDLISVSVCGCVCVEVSVTLCVCACFCVCVCVCLCVCVCVCVKWQKIRTFCFRYRVSLKILWRFSEAKINQTWIIKVSFFGVILNIIFLQNISSISVFYVYHWFIPHFVHVFRIIFCLI